MAKACALTTEDNPYNPFEEFADWFRYDVLHGYNSCEYLARIAHTSQQLTDQQNDAEVERAIDFIVANDILNIGYIKVYDS